MHHATNPSVRVQRLRIGWRREQMIEFRKLIRRQRVADGADVFP